ncbi:MAG: TonB-dependent receptor [Candidatus Omnitrophota bacterium]
MVKFAHSLILAVIYCSIMFVNLVFCEEPIGVELEQIIITPLGTEQRYGEVSRAADVIHYKGADSAYSQTISRPLSKLTSVSVIDYGSLGASKAVSIRGSSAQQVLVLIDSRPINDPRSGQAELHKIPVDAIDRIEVIKGPASAIYGSSAIGGVINVITKVASKKPKTTIESSFGAFKTFHESLSNSATVKDFGYYFNYTYDSSLGHRDNSQYRADNWTTRLNYRVAEDNTLFFDAGYFEDKGGAPGTVAAPQVDDFQFDANNYLNLRWSAELFEDAKININGYQNTDRLDFVNSYNPLRKDSAWSRVRGIVFQYTQEFFDVYKMIVGFDGKDNKINSSTAKKHRYVVRSPFLQNEVSIGKDWSLNFGSRWDDYSNFKKEPTQSAGLAYKVNDMAKLRVNYAKGFRAPTFNDLYWPSSRSSSGNPDLTPEKSWTWEGGFDIEYPNELEISATYFTNKLKELINWSQGDDRVWRPYNVNSAKIDGAEFKTVVLLLKDLKLDIGYTYLNPMDTNLDRYLTYRAKHKLDFGLTYEAEKLNVKLWGESLGRRYVNTSNSELLKQDLIMYLDTSYKVNNNLTGFVSIDNMFNKKYQRISGYPMPGFSVKGGLKADF